MNDDLRLLTILFLPIMIILVGIVGMFKTQGPRFTKYNGKSFFPYKEEANKKFAIILIVGIVIFIVLATALAVL